MPDMWTSATLKGTMKVTCISPCKDICVQLICHCTASPLFTISAAKPVVFTVSTQNQILKEANELNLGLKMIQRRSPSPNASHLRSFWRPRNQQKNNSGFLSFRQAIIHLIYTSSSLILDMRKKCKGQKRKWNWSKGLHPCKPDVVPLPGFN